jgi:hypothetical protein
VLPPPFLLLLPPPCADSLKFTPFSITKALPAQHPLVAQYGCDEQQLWADERAMAAASNALRGRTCRIAIEAE